MLSLQFENYLHQLYHQWKLIGWGEWRSFDRFISDVFSKSTNPKPIGQTIRINVLYYRIYYALCWVFFLIPVFLFHPGFRNATLIIGCFGLIYYLLIRGEVFKPHFLYRQVLGMLCVVIAAFAYTRSLYSFFNYIVCCIAFILVHAIFLPVTKETEYYYRERMLYLEVDGKKDDPRDIYINGIADLHLNGELLLLSIRNAHI